jgi:DNA uptake protein ComE-like DNA-binding protein
MRRLDDTHRVLGLVAIAVTAGLAVAGFANGSADAHGVAERSMRQAGSASAGVVPIPSRPVRVVYSGPLVTAGGENDRPMRRVEAPARGVAPEPAQASPQVSEPATTGSITLARPEARVQVAARGIAAPESEVRGADAAARRGIDLNTASIDDLNAIGAGRIGKAIARGRPYASPEDLLGKRVLNRATFARIKDQVTVR